MMLASPLFFAFLAVVLAGYHLLQVRRWKYAWLTLASWLYYAAASPGYLWVIWLLTLIDFFAGRAIGATLDPRRRLLWLIVSLISNLGLLAVFKYAMFATDNAVSVARLVGFQVTDRTWEWLLPLGISFHTFQGLSYTIDIYRKQIEPVKSLADYALFVAFFPQMAAGPIVRAVEFLPQMVQPPRVTAELIEAGLKLFVSGLVKKLFMADQLHLLLVEPVFAAPQCYESSVQRWAVLGWAVQIYCDFSGYTDMALGTAKWFGFELPRNFNRPYLATSISDFWRRWHLSLSTWLRDYLYFPLGGSKRGEWRTTWNLLFVFTLCGLWHGAAWHWLVYGLFNGLLMAAHRAFDRACGPAAWRRHPLWVLTAWLLTMFQLLLGLILIRMESWSGGVQLLQSLCGMPHVVQPGGVFLQVPFMVYPLLLIGVSGHIFALFDTPKLTIPLPNGLGDLLRGGALATGVIALVVLGPSATKSFIYIVF